MTNVCCTCVFSEKFNSMILPSSLLISNIHQSNKGHSIPYLFCMPCKWIWPCSLEIHSGSRFWISIRICTPFIKRLMLASYPALPLLLPIPFLTRNTYLLEILDVIKTWYFWSPSCNSTVQSGLRITGIYYITSIIPSLPQQWSGFRKK